ncbi:MAG: hypothetical protein H0X33_10105 [Taibaiella sp.]|nr:hypothetical protein [Taibaiella sp.]
MNKLFLRLVMLPAGLWSSMGADTQQLQAILKAKLLMDDRKPLSFGRQRSSKKPNKWTTVKNMVFSAGMGMLYLISLFTIPDRLLALTVLFTTFLFLLTFMLITDFSNVLFDTRDKTVIFPRPVNDSTIFLSRMLHVFIYLLRIVLPMSLPAWIYLGILDGWKGALLFPVPLLLMVFLALFLVNGCYLVMMKLFKPEKFKEVLSSFQIAFTIIIMIVGYFGPRALQSASFAQINPKEIIWLPYLPSYWLAACWTWIGVPAAIVYTKWLSLLAIVVPLVCMWITVKVLAPQFARYIGAIDDVSDGPRTVTANGKPTRSQLYKKLAVLFNRNSAVQAGFMITWLQTSRSRTFKMRIYPMLAYVPIMFVFQLMNNRRSTLAETWAHLPETKLYLFLLYLSSILVITAVTYLTVSDQYKAAWVYYAMPLDKPGKVMIGAFKAMWVKYLLPFLFIVSIAIVYIWGTGTILDIVLAVTNITMFAMVMLRVSFRNFPFSCPEQMSNSGNKFMKIFVSLLVPAILGAAHYFALQFWWLKLILLGLSAMFLWLVADSYANTSWADMRKMEME